MSHFEYLNTFVSFVFAIMVSRIVVTLSEVAFKKISWLHVGWLIVLAFNMFQMWWLRWSYNDSQGYNYFDYLIFLAPAFALAFTVAVLTPSDEPPDWSEFLKSKRIQFFSSYGIFWLTLISGYIYDGGDWRGVAGPFVLCVLGVLIENKYFQYMLLAFFVVALTFMAYQLGIST